MTGVHPESQAVTSPTRIARKNARPERLEGLEADFMSALSPVALEDGDAQVVGFDDQVLVDARGHLPLYA